MARQSRAPQLAVLAALGLVVAACGTSKLTPASAPKAAAPRTLADPAKPSPLDPALALAHVAYLTEPALEGRGTATQGDYLADAYIEQEFQKHNLLTTRQAFTNSAFRGTAHNVIALLPASERSDKYIVVGAHKDHLGKRWGKVYPGANDNAGGTAAVLEIARILADRTQSGGDRPRTNILFMTFSGEELGLIGSRYYTQNPIVPTKDGGVKQIDLKQIIGMVNLDCIAVGITDSLGTDAVVGDVRTRNDLGRLAARHGMKNVFKPFSVPHGHREADGHGHAPDSGRELPPGASSDHASFRRAGVRAICYYAEPVFSKFLHAPEDTIPARDFVQKKPEDRFNVDNLVRIGAVALDTVVQWSSEATSGR